MSEIEQLEQENKKLKKENRILREELDSANKSLNQMAKNKGRTYGCS